MTKQNKQNPFAVLGYSRGLVARLSTLPPQPDAIKKTAEVLKRHLLLTCHPDRTIGGTEESADISQAYEEIERPGEERDRYMAEFLSRDNMDVRQVLAQERRENGELRETLATLSREMKKLEQAAENQEVLLKTALRQLYADTLFAHHTNPSLGRLEVLTDLLDPPDRYVILLQDDDKARGMFILCQRRQALRFSDFEGNRYTKKLPRQKEPVTNMDKARNRLLARLDLLESRERAPIIIGSLPKDHPATERVMNTREAVEKLNNIHFSLIKGWRLVTAMPTRQLPIIDSQISVYAPRIKEIEILSS